MSARKIFTVDSSSDGRASKLRDSRCSFRAKKESYALDFSSGSCFWSRIGRDSDRLGKKTRREEPIDSEIINVAYVTS